MDDFETPQNELERAIAAVVAVGDDDPEGNARRAVFVALATHTVSVLMPELGDDDSPPENPQPLFVSDGPNVEQPMLAAFTRSERAQDFQTQQGAKALAVEINGTQLILGTPEDVGILLNPNQALGFRILPELTKAIRDDVLESAENVRARDRNDVQ
ncbi:MAG: SseB family protein [Gammaproteobacteria bacterium]